MTRETPTGVAREAVSRVDVVHVTHALKAGLRRYIVDLVTGLEQLGLRQLLVYSPQITDPATRGALEALAALGVPALEVPMVREISPMHDAASAARLWRLLRRVRPRVVHLHSSKAGGLGRIAARALPASTAVVYTPNASAANLSPRYVAIERALARLRATTIVAVSGSEHDELSRLRFVPPGRLVRVDTGVAVEEIRQASRAAPAPVLPAGPLVVAAGRLSAQKNPRLLVRASRVVAAARPDVHFVWAGDGELQADVERDIAEAGLRERWTVLPPLANPYPLLAAATVVALPSRYEGLPLVLLEAMALGRPMVATDVTGSRDVVIPGETGEIVPPDDAGALAAALEKMLAAPALAARYGAESARRADRYYTRERMAREMLEVYRAGAAFD